MKSMGITLATAMGPGFGQAEVIENGQVRNIKLRYCE